MRHSVLICTDSGGIQEEAPSFGVPLLILRDQTERMEGVNLGLATLVGTQKDNIIQAVKVSLSHDQSFRASIKNPYGDGAASLRICEAIKNYFSSSS